MTRYRTFFLFAGAYVLGVISALFLSAVIRERGRVVATVNNASVSRSVFVNRMTRLCGEDALSMLIDELVVRQEMARRNVKALSKEVKNKMLAFRASFPSEEKFQDWKKKHHLTQDDMKAQAEVDVGLEKLVAKTLDEKELQKYYKNAKTNFRDKVGKILPFEAARPQIAAIFIDQKKKDFLEKLRGASKIRRFFLTIPLRVE